MTVYSIIHICADIITIVKNTKTDAVEVEDKSLLYLIQMQT